MKKTVTSLTQLPLYVWLI